MDIFEILTSTNGGLTASAAGDMIAVVCTSYGIPECRVQGQNRTES